MSECLIISEDAMELEAEVIRLADELISVTACGTPEEALTAYSDEVILFGRPDMIAAILPELPTIKWVQSTWTGVEPLVTLDRNDYVLTVVKGVFGPQMSEYVFSHLLAHEQKLPERMRQQRAHHWFETFSGSLQGKRLGIMGTGSIGRHIASTANAFGVQTIGLSRSGTPVPGFKHVMCVDEISSFLAQIDYLVAALPRTPQTDYLLDAAALSQLQKHVYLINIGRSNVIDTQALISALNNGQLAGAALDVFDEEPIPDSSPLWDTVNLSITAHIAAVSHPSLIVPIFLENYRRFTGGKNLRHVFDFDAGY